MAETLYPHLEELLKRIYNPSTLLAAMLALGSNQGQILGMIHPVVPVETKALKRFASHISLFRFADEMGLLDGGRLNPQPDYREIAIALQGVHMVKGVEELGRLVAEAEDALVDKRWLEMRVKEKREEWERSQK